MIILGTVWLKAVFFAGAMDSEGGIAQTWLEHPMFTDKEGRKWTVRQMPNFFETFPIILPEAKCWTN